MVNLFSVRAIISSSSGEGLEGGVGNKNFRKTGKIAKAIRRVSEATTSWEQ